MFFDVMEEDLEGLVDTSLLKNQFKVTLTSSPDDDEDDPPIVQPKRQLKKAIKWNSEVTNFFS